MTGLNTACRTLQRHSCQALASYRAHVAGVVMEVAVLSTVEESLRRCTLPGLLVGVQGPQGIIIIGALETSADAGP